MAANTTSGSPPRRSQTAGTGGDPDGALIGRIRAGETALFAELTRRYNQPLYRIARAILRDPLEAEDVVQEAYLTAFARLDQFQGRALFSTWLTRILINCARQHLRKRARGRETGIERIDLRGKGFPGAPDPEGVVERKVLQEQLGRIIERALDEIPPKYRVVFIMRELSDTPVAATAAALGISEASVKVRLHRARRLLRESIERLVPDIKVYGFDGDRCERLTTRVMSAIGEIGGPHRRG